jgi:hypothetical protein
MAQYNRFNRRGGKKQVRQTRSTASEMPAIEIPQPREPVVYGKPFIVLQDAQNSTFEYRQGGWVPFAMTISQCRIEGEVKELPQKINNMTRYEVRLPLSNDG